jgi:hypothetical protein
LIWREGVVVDGLEILTSMLKAAAATAAD